MQKDVDVFCFQEVLWGSQPPAQTKPKTFKCSLRYKTVSVDAEIDFSSQTTVHRDVCRAFGFPNNFEFQLKDENNFVFYPSKKQPYPRNHQKKLIIGSFMNQLENWVKPDQAIPGTHVEKLM